MEEQLGFSRTRMASEPNPFSDPAVNKSLPRLPPPPKEPTLSEFQASIPGTPPLPPYLPFGSRPSRPSLQRVDQPSVKEMAASFERDHSAAELASRNPYRDEQESPIRTKFQPVEPEPRPDLAKDQAVSPYLHRHSPTLRLLEGLDPSEGSDRITGYTSIYSDDPLPSPGAEEHQHMQQNGNLGHSLYTSRDQAAESSSQPQPMQHYHRHRRYPGESHAEASGGYFAVAGVDHPSNKSSEEPSFTRNAKRFTHGLGDRNFKFPAREALTEPEPLSYQATSEQNITPLQHAFAADIPLAGNLHEQNASLSARQENNASIDAPPGFVPPTDEELADGEILSEDERPKSPSPLSVSVYQRQGLDQSVTPYSSKSKPKSPHYKNLENGNEASNINATKRSVLTLEPPENARKDRQAEQDNIFADQHATSSQNAEGSSSTKPAWQSSVEDDIKSVGGEGELTRSERYRGPTISMIMADQSPAPPIPDRSSKRRKAPGTKGRIPIAINTSQRPWPQLPLHTPAQTIKEPSPEFLAAIRAESLLQSARDHMVPPRSRQPHVQPSPTYMRLAMEIARNRGIKLHTGSRAVIRSVSFWVTAAVLQSSVVSTAAAITYVVVEMRVGGGTDVQTGSMIWLVMSIGSLVVSGISILFVCARNMGYFETFRKKLGCDEVGLIDRMMHQEEFELSRRSGDIENPPSAYNRQPRFLPSVTPSIYSSHAGSEWQNSMYPEPRYQRVYQATPSRQPSGSRPNNVMDDGYSPAGIEPSPLTPAEAALKKEGTQFPVFDYGSAQNLQKPPRKYLARPKEIAFKLELGDLSGVGVSGRSPLDHLQADFAVANAAPESLRHSVIQQTHADFQERSSIIAKQRLDNRSGNLRRMPNFDSSPGGFTNSGDEENQRSGGVYMDADARRYALQCELERIAKSGSSGSGLTRSHNLPNLVGQSSSPYRATDDAARNGAEYEHHEVAGMSRSRALLTGLSTGVRDHFREPYGRSLWSAVTDKKGKEKEWTPF